jgi:hypothetical protein
MYSESNLSSLQLEILKLYSFNPSEKDLLEVKRILGEYFAKKLSDNASQKASETNLTNEDLDAILNEENQ